MKKENLLGKILILLFAFISSAYALQIKRDFIYNDKKNRDPLNPLVTKEGRVLPGINPQSETENVNLEGVMLDSQGKSIAIINGKVVKEQDRVLGMQVLKIKSESVIMQREGKVFVINLRKGGEGKNEIK